ncbi:unnamed protein product [Meloidogyne enterolobii]|uniref:Uncharacterized protein n=1 Tax=Meloidogyne enterolobii TaxID=390850 RepID=A0ACB0ZUU4_MELEN
MFTFLSVCPPPGSPPISLCSRSEICVDNPLAAANSPSSSPNTSKAISSVNKFSPPFLFICCCSPKIVDCIAKSSTIVEANKIHPNNNKSHKGI